MNRSMWKGLLIGAVVAVVLSSAAPQADAQWWGYYRPVAWGCGYGGCYSSYYPATNCCYSPCSYDSCGSWYLGWRPGPVRRLLLGRYRWYWDGCGSSCYANSCGTTYSGCCGDGAVAAPAAGVPTQAPTPAKKPVAEPAMPTEPGMPPESPAPAMPDEPSDATMPKTTNTSAENSGILTVWVPYDAKVTINGLETRSSGSRRQFVSYGLKPGFSYKYEVKAEVVRNGEVQVDTRTVMLTAGQIEAVAFGFNAPAQQFAAAH